MHFEILVEDQSGKQSLDILVPKIIGINHTFSIHAYKGIGHIPRNMRNTDDPSKRILLNNLPKLLKGYGRTFSGYGSAYPAVVIVVCDLDRRCLKQFRVELFDILDQCNPKPKARFCIAIEEGEAWFLGDIQAIKKVYSHAKDEILQSYDQDSICGTWELLADAIYHGGALNLKSKGWQTVGAEKSKWALDISPRMNLQSNRSPSFRYFYQTLITLTETTSNNNVQTDR